MSGADAIAALFMTIMFLIAVLVWRHVWHQLKSAKKRREELKERLRNKPWTL